jgi:hypothetical protein
MKRILGLLTFLTLSATAYGQGQVHFENTSATRFTTNHLGNSGLMSGANAYRIGLWIAPDGTANESLFTLIAVATNSALLAGRFSHPENPFTMPGNNKTPIAFQVRAWLISDPFLSGKSPIGRVTPAVGGGPPPRLFSSVAGVAEFPGQLTEGIIIGVPEPGTLALATLSALLLFFCRKKRTAR